MGIITEISKEETEIVRQKEIKKTVKYLGKLKLQRGQHLYELNAMTKLITQIEISDTAMNLKGDVRKKFVMKEGCFYVPAINLKNAEKKFLKMIG